GSDEVTLAETIEYSCNIPMAQLADELGAKAIREQAERFGFGSEFEVPLASVPSVYDPSGAAQVAQSGYGQNRVLSTPLQAAMWTAAIANGGTLMSPWMVDQVVGDDLSVQQQ